MNHAAHPPDAPPPGDDAARWQEAARLRTEHGGWVIVWLARTGQFRAYKRLPGARRDAALAAATAADLATQITAAEQTARARPGPARSARPARRGSGTR